MDASNNTKGTTKVNKTKHKKKKKKTPKKQEFDLDSELAEVIEISGPVFSEKNAGGLVISVDSLRYDQSGRKIVFDYLSCTLPTFNQCKANPSQSYWSIGVLEVASKQITYPYKTQGSNIDLTYPAFSNNTDQVITYSANISVDSVQLSLVNIFNSQTRETACAILEGSREAFERRALIYGNNKNG